MIKTVLLDVDNTLLDFNLCADESMHIVADKMGIVLPDNIFEVFHGINTVLWHDIEKGKLTRDELHKIRWNMVFDKVNIKADGIGFEKLFVSTLHESAVPVVGAKELLEYLHGKYQLCVASNAAEQQQLSRLKKADMLKYMEHLFVSEKIGAPKPSANFFDACISALGDVRLDEIMMIGDSLSADIIGAHDYGLKTCWYNHEKTDTPPDICADYIVNSLDEIKAIL